MIHSAEDGREDLDVPAPVDEAVLDVELDKLEGPGAPGEVDRHLPGKEPLLKKSKGCRFAGLHYFSDKMS